MRTIPLIAASAAASLLAFAAAPAAAEPVTLGYIGVQIYTVPTTGLYGILAAGAQGGTGTFQAGGPPGGLGAEADGIFTLTAGEMLTVAVGGKGGDAETSGGGGGGSFVVAPGGVPLLVAGGGGGSTFYGAAGGPGLADVSGGDGSAGGGAGGVGGSGGGGYSSGGGGGYLGGGGGGSFDTGADPLLLAGVNVGDGSVVVTPPSASIPEPASLALLGTGLLGFGLGLARRRRRAT